MFASSVRRAGRIHRKAGSSRHVPPPALRHFTRNSQLLLISRSATRPQLPYLYVNSQRSSPFQQQIARLLTTETKKVIKDTVIGAIRLNIYFWLAIGLGSIAWMGWRHEEQEGRTPTPPDWSWWSRWYFREAKEKQFPHQLQGFQAPNWVHVATNMKSVIERLEDPNIDGQGVVSALGEGEGAILIQGVGKTGADISGKSEPWRRGYFQALMTAGLAAEHVEGYVKDKSRDGRLFPPQVVVGPSNPTPRPMPLTKQGIEEAPREENCEVFFDTPQVHYMKILTTTGFNNDQKLQSALAFADWLSFKGLSGSAREMYDWAIDIASDGYAPGETVPIDKSTGILRVGMSPITSNLLTTATSLAVHYAKSDDLGAALPSFLSILQAQRQLPVGKQKSEPAYPSSPASQWGFLSAIIKDAPYPPPPPSGDQPATRTHETACDEAGTLAHIGEILYVTPSSSLPGSLVQSKRPKNNDAVEPTPAQEAGLAWTKQAVDLAETALEALCGRDRPQVIAPGSNGPSRSIQKELGVTGEELQKAKESCAACLEMAMANWQQMVGRLAAQERDIEIARAKAAQPAESIEPPMSGIQQPAKKASGSWLGWGSNEVETADIDTKGDKPVGKWMAEADTVVLEKKNDIRQMFREEKLPSKQL